MGMSMDSWSIDIKGSKGLGMAYDMESHRNMIEDG